MPEMISQIVCSPTWPRTWHGGSLSSLARMLTCVAPRLLALFGERVTMQFMSQSTGWADNIILAMAPLGIITAIIGAIRVGGPTWLKTIIGRARESRAIVEAELMSSASKEVCELWNGQEIVRVMGAGPIREFTILLPEATGGGPISGPIAGPLVSQTTSVMKLSEIYLKPLCRLLRNFVFASS